MPPDGKYLLLFASASHTLISGGDILETERGKGVHSDTNAANGDNDKPRARHRGSRSEPSDAAGRPERTPRAQSLSLSPHSLSVFERQELTDIQQTSTAYLDAIMKHNASASEWLSRDAGRWLGNAANFSYK
jgi:hypothetical protein